MNDLVPLSWNEYNQYLSHRMNQRVDYNGYVYTGRLIEFAIQLTTNLYYADHVTVKPLSFFGCRFTKKVDIGSHQQAGPVSFENCTFDEFLNVSSTGNCEIKGSAVLVSAEIFSAKNDEFENWTVLGSLVVKGKGGLTFKNVNKGIAERMGRIEVHGSKSVYFNDTNIADCDLNESRCKEIWFNRVNMRSCCFKDLAGPNAKVIFRASIVDQVLITDPESPDTSLEISESSKIQTVKYDLGSFGTFSCLNSTIDTLEFFGVGTDNGYVKVSNTKVKNLHFRDLRNKGIIELSGIKQEAKGILRMKLASLGRTEFILCDFKEGVFEFDNSRITDAFMAETDFPERVMNGGEESFVQAQLAFGQIATAFQTQGDTVRYLEYQSREIAAHYNGLEYFPNGLKSFSFTKLSLLLNKWSNDFGRNWVRGIVFSFLVGAIFFYFLIVSSKQYRVGWGFQWDSRWIGSYLRFMNPLRFFETENLFKTADGGSFLTLSQKSYVIDFFSRVLVAYGYYQTIQAFRRFGRSK